MHVDTGLTVMAAQGGGEVAAVLRGRFLSRSPGELTTKALGIHQRTQSGGHILDTVGESQGFPCLNPQPVGVCCNRSYEDPVKL